jgi:predicted transcriptional regulator
MMTKRRIPGMAILRDIQRQKEEKKQLQKEMFRQVYNRPKEKAFSDIDQLNMDSFRAIRKSVILDYGLSKAALAIYPVLCAKADFEKNNSFQISQENIAFYSGVSESKVRRAIAELEGARLLSKEKITEGTRHFYVYKVIFYRRPELEANEQRGDAIYFYNCIIDNGIWAELKPRAKVLYLTLRAVAKQDIELYSVIEGEDYGGDWTGVNYDDYIRNRKWDVCDISLSKLCKLAKIERTNLTPILEELERYKLIERVDRWIKVYLRPGRLRPGRLLRHKTLTSDLNSKIEGKQDKNSRYVPLAERLASIIRSHKRINVTSQKIASWANEIRKLVEIDGVSIQRVETALDWYEENIGGEYIPVIESGSSLRSKFINLEDAMRRVN